MVFRTSFRNGFGASFQARSQPHRSRLGPDQLAEQLRLRAVAGLITGTDGWARRSATRLVAELGAEGPGDEPDDPVFGAAAELTVSDALARRWQWGWQPVDVWQIARRRGRPDSVEFVVGALAGEALRYPPAAVHPRWRAQLAELDATVWWDRALAYPAAWANRTGIGLVDMLAMVLETVALLDQLPAQPVLIPPPGSPEAARGSAEGGASAESGRAGEGEVDPKILGRVRGLLAKAESTDYPEEADALFAKAQELMSRYSLERAVVEAMAESGGAGAPVRTDGRRIWLDNPYLGPKSMLVGAVAEANRCRAVFSPELGFVTVIGEHTDAEIVEVLTTSLLVQADRAMLAAGRHVGRSGQSRTKSFRQSFLISYAQRIGERLASAAAEAETAVSDAVGGGLLPVLAARDRAVRERVDELFPRLTTRRVSVSNAAGWTAGRVAADLAVLDVRRAVRG